MSEHRITPIWTPDDTRQIIAESRRHKAIPARPADDRKRNRLGVRATLALIAFGWILGAALYYSVPAKADPADDYTVGHAYQVCAALTNHNTVDGVVLVIAAIEHDTGFGGAAAGKIIATSVIGWCPEHTGLLNRFIDAYATTTSAGWAV